MSGIAGPMLQRIYLDANAGLPLRSEARTAMIAALGHAANASSVHAEGRRARALIEEARNDVAAAVAARPENVIFTSGATEAAALALTPDIYRGPVVVRAGRLYIGATEHSCVLAGGRFSAGAAVRLPVHSSGVLDLDALERALAGHDSGEGAPYLALMLANNETGVIHPVAQAARMVKARGGFVFCDAVQALGRIPVDIGELGADFLALSAHKIGGPQGAGALVLADESVRPAPLLTGGGQERRRRSGTENVAAIAGFGVAAKLANHHLQEAGRIERLRERLEREIGRVTPEARIFGTGAKRLPNTTLFGVTSIEAETAVIAFDLAGIAVSAGSACSSGKVAESHVLEAMGQTDFLGCGIRVSLTPQTNEGDIEGFADVWSTIHARMGQSRAA